MRRLPIAPARIAIWADAVSVGISIVASRATVVSSIIRIVGRHRERTSTGTESCRIGIGRPIKVLRMASVGSVVGGASSSGTVEPMRHLFFIKAVAITL